MENNVENEICNNCKKEIPQPNYVMHSMHCARNITLCKICKEPIPKPQFADHEKRCKKPIEPKPLPPPTNIEKSSYYQSRKVVEDKKTEARKERYLQKMDRLVDSGYSLNASKNSPTFSKELSSYSRESSVNFSREQPEASYRSRFSNDMHHSAKNEAEENGLPARKRTEVQREERVEENATTQLPLPPLVRRPEPAKSSGLLACRYCDLELPKLDLEEHENYCGSRTDKCLECGELVMFKDKQIHMDSNHGFLKKKAGQLNVRWDSDGQRSESQSESRPRRNQGARPFAEFDYDPMPYLPSTYQAPGGGAKKKEGESYKEISRRLDCFAGPSPPPSAIRRRNPPTELVIPCEFCNVPIPHEDLVQHESGCRPDLARYNPRRKRSSPEDDYYVEPAQNSVDDEELPCEFCGDMIPASRLYSHQIQCN